MTYLSLATTGNTVNINVPDTVEYRKSKTLKRLYFWSSTTVYDQGLNSEQVILSGTHTSSSGTNANVLIGELISMTNYGGDVTISGLDDTTYNKTFCIVSFDFQESGGFPEVYDYMITLEKV